MAPFSITYFIGLIAVCIGVGGLLWMGCRHFYWDRRPQSELAYLPLIAQNTGGPVLVINPAGVIDWTNPSFTQISGYASGELTGQTIYLALFGSAPEMSSLHCIKDQLSTGSHFSLQIQCQRKNQQAYWLLMDFSPVYSEHKELVHYVCSGADISVLKSKEEEIHHLNRRNEMLLKAAAEGIFGIDERGNISFINPAGARLTEWDADELIGQPASVILHQLSIDTLPGRQNDHFMAAALLDGSVAVGDTDMFRRKEGQPFPVEYSSQPIYESNQPVGTVAVFRDISDRKRTEAMRFRQARQSALRADIGHALAADETLGSTLNCCAQALVEYLHVAFARIWTLSADKTTLELQASAGIYTHLHGPHSRIPVGSHLVGCIAKDRTHVLKSDLAAESDLTDADWAQREKMISFAGMPLIAQGHLIGVMAMFSREPLPEDTLDLLTAVAEPIAQGVLRARAKAKIKEQAAWLDKAQDAILVVDLADHCVFWNKGAERLYGWTAPEVLGRKIDELVYGDKSFYEKARASVMESGEWQGECRQVTSGDEPVVVESQWTLVHNDEGNPQSILIVNTDIGERKAIEAQFLRTQRMESIGTLAGGIAHDLNNVLAPIMMAVPILQSKLQNTQCLQLLSILESSAKRGADMVRQVLTFARGVEGERMLLQARHLMKEVSKMVGETFPKSIHLRARLADNLWPIMGDATQLHQVMVNLTVNARDAMPSGGVLTLSAENVILESGQLPLEGIANHHITQPGNYALIKVADTGTGIPPELLGKIFEPFFTTKEVGEGTGLGLATVLGIIKSHGGSLQVQSKENKGTTFSIYLPALDKAADESSSSDAQELPMGSGELILTVDDESAVLTMTKETLESYGYRVLTANDGTEAIAAYTLHRQEIRGVLTDMLMPYMDGPATIRALRKLDPGLKIIAVSGLMDKERVRDSTGMDNIAFLMKPYSAHTLITTIQEALAERN